MHISYFAVPWAECLSHACDVMRPLYVLTTGGLKHEETKCKHRDLDFFKMYEVHVCTVSKQRDKTPASNTTDLV